VDPSTTERVVASAGDRTDVMFVALSGISSRVDVQRYRCAGVQVLDQCSPSVLNPLHTHTSSPIERILLSTKSQSVLVGEALMRCSDPRALIKSLRGEDATVPVVKICGISDASAASHAVRSGADIIGLVFTESSRKVIQREIQRTRFFSFVDLFCFSRRQTRI
jgi:hypothetical protein